MPSIRLFTPPDDWKPSPKTALLILFEMVRDGELTVEQALAHIRFERPEERQADEPLRFRFDMGPHGFRVLLLLVRDKIFSPEKILSTMDFE